MPIDSKHPDYLANIGKWTRCRDAFDGSDAVKAKGTDYLPRLLKQRPKEYEAYKRRALFYAITSKTVGALVGMASVRSPVVKFPSSMDSYYIDDKGVQFMENMSKTMEEILLMGRVGLFVDMPVDGGDPKPFIYTAESIINWKLDDNGNPRMVILEEWYQVPGKDEYEMVTDVRYRKLWMNGDVYMGQTFTKKGEPLSAAVIPQIRGKPMDHIPFWVANPIGLGFEVAKSPMIDIVDINLSHYISSADLEHGRHFTALPTPYVTGVSGGTTELAIGSTTAWVLPDVQSKVGFLEFTGQGLQSLEKALEEKQSQLASLSARIMDGSANGSEAADVVRLRYTSETASLASVVRSDEALLSTVYREIATMLDSDPSEVMITLNKEFLDANMKPAEIVDLVDSYLKGGMSTDTFIFNLRRGNVIPTSIDDEEEKRAVEAMVEKARKAAEAKAKPAGKPTQ